MTTQSSVSADSKEMVFTEPATVTVTFNPTLNELEAQLNALPVDSIKVFVDNASNPQIWSEIKTLTDKFHNVHLIRSEKNLGLGAAINCGVEWLAALTPCPEFVLLLDQDSEPLEGSIEELLAKFKQLRAAGVNVGCVGPLLEDSDTSLTHGFHQSTRWRWKRAYPPVGSHELVPCANVNGSGTLMPVSLFQQLGGLDETLFIDHIDTEWSFRVAAHGYSLWGVPSAVFNHSMGEESMRFWLFGWRVWPVRSPVRHYYLFRNAVVLIKRPYVPRVWKFWAVTKLILTAVIMTITGPSRTQQLKNMWIGIRKGACSKTVRST